MVIREGRGGTKNIKQDLPSQIKFMKPRKKFGSKQSLHQSIQNNGLTRIED